MQLCISVLDGLDPDSNSAWHTPDTWVFVYKEKLETCDLWGKYVMQRNKNVFVGVSSCMGHALPFEKKTKLTQTSNL